MFDTKKESIIARTFVACSKKTRLPKNEIAGKIKPNHLFSFQQRKICNKMNSAKGTSHTINNIHNNTLLVIAIPTSLLSLSDML